MAKGRNIRDLTRYMMATRSAVVKGHARALLEMTLTAERFAKRNVTNKFGKTSSERRLSGRLLNSVFSGFDIQPGIGLPSGFIGTRGLPYGRIHELGGKIEPKKAQHLWVKNTYDQKAYSFNKRLTPRKWFQLFKASKGSDLNYRFGFKPDGSVWSAGVEEDGEFTPLFFLRDDVEMPARPYLTPAVSEAVNDYGKVAGKHIRSALAARFFGR